MTKKIPDNKKELARSFRKKPTKTEKMVWNVLRDRWFMGLKFRRQHYIDGFIVDFYCNELKLVIELDGKIHEKQKEYDECRQKLISQKGIKFIRVSNEDIEKDMGILLDQISKLA